MQKWKKVHRSVTFVFFTTNSCKLLTGSCAALIILNIVNGGSNSEESSELTERFNHR